MMKSKFCARVLVVDDYFINQEVTKELLEQLNCQVDVARDGSEALSLYSRYAYDAIFLDIQMPGMDGCEVAKQIRQIEHEKKHVPLIAITADALIGDREKCLEAGMDDYIIKPIKMSDIDSLLKKYLKQ